MAYTLKLKDRGNSVIRCIDLFDECHYGADKLFLRGKFGTPQDVAEQVKIALGGGSLDTTKLKDIYGVEITPQFIATKLGIGNPLTPEDENGIQTIPTIALNRYHIPNKKFWNNTPPSDVENPYKASAAVKFSIRLYFRDDYAYITFGCPWELTSEYGTGSLDESSTAQNFIDKFTLLNCHFISKEDALQVLDVMFDNKVSENTAAYVIMRNAPQIVTETTELVDEDGSLISL